MLTSCFRHKHWPHTLKIRLNPHQPLFSTSHNSWTSRQISFLRVLWDGKDFWIDLRSFCGYLIDFWDQLRFAWPPHESHSLNYWVPSWDPWQMTNLPRFCKSISARISPLNSRFLKLRPNLQRAWLTKLKPSFECKSKKLLACFPIIAKIWVFFSIDGLFGYNIDDIWNWYSI